MPYGRVLFACVSRLSTEGIADDVLSPKGINKLIFVMVMRCVFFAVGTEFCSCHGARPSSSHKIRQSWGQ